MSESFKDNSELESNENEPLQAYPVNTQVSERLDGLSSREIFRRNRIARLSRRLLVILVAISIVIGAIVGIVKQNIIIGIGAVLLAFIVVTGGCLLLDRILKFARR